MGSGFFDRKSEQTAVFPCNCFSHSVRLVPFRGGNQDKEYEKKNRIESAFDWCFFFLDAHLSFISFSWRGRVRVDVSLGSLALDGRQRESRESYRIIAHLQPPGSRIFFPASDERLRFYYFVCACAFLACVLSAKLKRKRKLHVVLFIHFSRSFSHRHDLLPCAAVFRGTNWSFKIL